jgi:excisionase family DNA binding protein
MKGRAAHRGPAQQADTVSDSDTAFANRRLLSPTEAATYLGLTSRFAIYRLVSSGKLPAVRLANKVRIAPKDRPGPAGCPISSLLFDLARIR